MIRSFGHLYAIRLGACKRDGWDMGWREVTIRKVCIGSGGGECTLLNRLIRNITLTDDVQYIGFIGIGVYTTVRHLIKRDTLEYCWRTIRETHWVGGGELNTYSTVEVGYHKVT